MTRFTFEEAKKLGLVEKTKTGFRWKNLDGSYTEIIPLVAGGSPNPSEQEGSWEGVSLVGDGHIVQTASDWIDGFEKFKSVYDSARNATSGYVSTIHPALDISYEQQVLEGEIPDTWFYHVRFSRGFLFFDTSELGTDLYIRHARLTLYPESAEKSEEVPTSILEKAPEYVGFWDNLYIFSTSVTPPLEASDYNHDFDTYLRGSIDFEDIANAVETGGSVSVELPGGAITQGGVTVFTLKGAIDTGGDYWWYNPDEYIHPAFWRAAMHKFWKLKIVSGDGTWLKRPKLVVNYLVIPDPPEFPFAQWALVYPDYTKLNETVDYLKNVYWEGEVFENRIVFGVNVPFPRAVEVEEAKVRIMCRSLVDMFGDKLTMVLEQLRTTFNQDTVTWDTIPEVHTNWFAPISLSGIADEEKFFEVDVTNRVNNKDDAFTSGASDWAFWGKLTPIYESAGYLFNIRQPSGYEWRKPHLKVVYKFKTMVEFHKPPDSVVLEEDVIFSGRILYEDGTTIPSGVEEGSLEIKDFLGEEELEPITGAEISPDGTWSLPFSGWTDPAHVGTHKLVAVYTPAYGSGLASSESDEQTIVVQKKVGELEFYVSDTTPVPGSSVNFWGCLLPEIGGLADQTIYLEMDGTDYLTTTTDYVGNFEFKDISFDSEVTHIFDVRFEGTPEYDPIHSAETEPPLTKTVSWQKEIPEISFFSVSPYSFVNTPTTLFGKFISHHGGTVSGLELEIKQKIDAEKITLATVRTDEKGKFEYVWTPTVLGDYTFIVEWDGNAQFLPTTSNEVYVSVVVKPIPFKPNWLVRIWDRLGTTLKFGEVRFIESLTVAQSTKAEFDTCSLVLDNEGQRYADISVGDLIEVRLGYGEHLVPTFIGVIEDIKKSLTSRGEKINLKCSDYKAVISRRYIDAEYPMTSPYEVVAGPDNIFTKAGITMNFRVYLPRYEVRTWTFQNRSILDCLKLVREGAGQLVDEEFEFFFEVPDVLAFPVPTLVFRAVPRAPTSIEQVEVGSNITKIEVEEDEGSVRNAVRLYGAMVDTLFTETITVTEILYSYYLKHTPLIRFVSLKVNGVTKEEGVDYTVNYEENTVNFIKLPPIGATVEFKYYARKRLKVDWITDPDILQDDESIEKYKRKEKTLIAPNVATESELKSIGAAILRVYKEPLLSIKLTAVGLPWLLVGQHLPLKWQDLEIDEAFKVVELRHRLTKRGGFTTDVTLKEARPDFAEIVGTSLEGLSDYGYHYERIS